MYADNIYATAVYASGESSSSIADGKHWAKQCPQVSDWNKLVPEIYSSSSCSQPQSFIETEQTRSKRKWV